MAVGGPGRPRHNIQKNRDDQTPSIILHRESDDVVASSLFYNVTGVRWACRWRVRQDRRALGGPLASSSWEVSRKKQK